MSKFEVIEFKIPTLEPTGKKEVVDAENPAEALQQLFKLKKVPKKEQLIGKTKTMWYPEGRKDGKTGWTAVKVYAKK